MSQRIQLTLRPDSLERLSKTIPLNMLGTRNQYQAFQLVQKHARNGTARVGDVLEMFILRTQIFVGGLTAFEEAGKGAAGAQKAFGDYGLVPIFGKAPIETFTKLIAFRDYSQTISDHLPYVGGKAQCRHGAERVAHDNASRRWLAMILAAPGAAPLVFLSRTEITDIPRV